MKLKTFEQEILFKNSFFLIREECSNVLVYKTRTLNQRVYKNDDQIKHISSNTFTRMLISSYIAHKLWDDHSHKYFAIADS